MVRWGVKKREGTTVTKREATEPTEPTEASKDPDHRPPQEEGGLHGLGAA